MQEEKMEQDLKQHQQEKEKNNIHSRSKYLTNIKKIYEWTKKNNRKPNEYSQDEEEKRLAVALRRIRMNLLTPYDYCETEEQKKIYKNKHPEYDEVKRIVDEINRNYIIIKIPMKLIYARNVQKWTHENNRLPSATAKDKVEQTRGRELKCIKYYLLKPYNKLKTEEEREEYKKKHPEYEEVKQIIDEIYMKIYNKLEIFIEEDNKKQNLQGTHGENNNVSRYLINAIKIREWMKKNNTFKEPNELSKDEEECELGKAIRNIRWGLLKKYDDLKTEEEREKYKKKHPEFDKVKKIIDEIDKMKIPKKLIQIREIYKWVRKNNRKPDINSQDNEEIEIAKKLKNIKRTMLSLYEHYNTEEREIYKKKHPEFDEVKRIVDEINEKYVSAKIPVKLTQARNIQKWQKEKNTTKKPNRHSQNEEEKKLGIQLSTIRQKLLKPYDDLKTEEEREEYKKKHPEYDAVKQIIDEIDRNNIPKFLINAIKIRKWMEEKNTTKPPSTESQNEEEKKLAAKLSNIRNCLLKPYDKLKTQEEREEYKKKHPEYDEVKQIIDEIDRNNTPKLLLNARNIQKWTKEKNKIPSQYTKDEEEKRLSRQLYTIKYHLLKPYDELQTEEERGEYKKKHPEFDEVKQIIDEIYANRCKKLESLIKEDDEKRKILEKAKEIETGYKKLLESNKDIGDTDA